MEKGAFIDPSGMYRYRLWRIWDQTLPLCLFIMLNPSTADSDIDDPTIRRCMSFAKAWGYGGIDVINIFAFRATKPQVLRQVDDPEGPWNQTTFSTALVLPSLIICAWGTNVMTDSRGYLNMLKALNGRRVFCLGTTAAGHPRHPLYVRGNTMPLPFNPNH